MSADAALLADLRAVCPLIAASNDCRVISDCRVIDGAFAGRFDHENPCRQDAHGLPITLKRAAEQAHDERSADDMLNIIGPGQTLLADAAYDSNRLRDRLAAIGVKAVIKPILRRSASLPLDRNACRRRDRIERFFSKLKYYRDIATRYETHDTNFLALIKRAATRIWLRAYGAMTQSQPGRFHSPPLIWNCDLPVDFKRSASLSEKAIERVRSH